MMVHIGNALSVGAVLAMLVGRIPALAGIITVFWLGVQLYDRFK
jgi:hypothetical protein